MKFVKSDLAKKLIIILIVLLLFNTLYPSMSYAIDFGGILMQPLYWLILGFMIPTDFAFGQLVRGTMGIEGDMSGSFILIDDKMAAIFGQTQWMDDGAKNLLLGPDTIFCGKITSLNANIFNHQDRNDTLGSVVTTVAKFYVILRNIAAIIMLGGLIFTGIRILLSANIPTKKTQYLMLLQDWLIGFALLIFSHIIMVLILTLAENITLALSGNIAQESIKISLVQKLGWSGDSTTQVLALVLYIWVSWLVVVFAIAYFKRFFWTCILAVFAPVMALMYSFGQQTKQIYSNWLKEFIMNAMVQPFHMIVYTVLISVPLGITGTGWNWGWENSVELMYGLMAISMIRPAEKYLRRLFGMDKGIANMASYDSGKQTFDSAKKAVVQTAKTAVAIGATIATGGAAAGAMGAAGAGAGAGASTAGALGETAGALGEAGEVAGELGEAGDALGQLGQAGDELGGLGEGTPEWIADGWDQDSQGRFFNPYDEEWYTQDQLMGGSEPTYMDQDDFDGSDAKALTDGIKNSVADSDDNNAETITESPSEFMKTLREGSEAKDENMTDEEVAKAVGSESVASMLKDAGFSEEQIASYLGTGSEGAGAGNIDASTVTINANSVNMEGASLESDNNDGIKTIEEGNLEGTAEVEKVELGEEDGISLEGAIDGANFGEIFKNLGGIEQLGNLANDLVDGAHSISAGLYVDGMAPTQEWNSNSQWRRENIKEAGEKRKENVERAKDNWAHDKANITIMTDKYMEKYLPEMQAKYGDSKPQSYIEAQAREKSEEKAKSALKDMSAYVPYGVTDVNLAYNLYQNANNNGLSPEQSIRNMAGFNKFNSNAGNINSINVSGNFQRSDYTTVEAAIPNAKTYYDAGYTNVNDMAWVDYMAEKLGKSPEFAMKVDETLKKKGKGGRLSYNGKDAEMKKVIDQINSHYN